ncbi:oligo-1,6-glucosidase [Bowdeniella nasicola]|uniref:Oligo-1,6-glucosidase n=1 Tax=Bowdeniella nasicola TaxID=208480 RepID=A0A1H4BTZ4_9ACTO|nr:alpha-glucosidase [Bowdeniella nasicola]SEA51553.1 oligo-1,6-glucosidase [Bowdeniella nasicola]
MNTKPQLDQWWRDRVVYQIYPRSFADSNGDGIGDLRGIIERVDHLAELGVGVVWLSPIYASPQDDNGYDISDYQAIDPTFGTLADFDELVAALHERDIRLVMDLVVNHTSDEHPWFVESASGRESAKRDWYIWRDPKPDGSEPNNWESFFSGPTWQFDEASGQYYLHLFSRKQPDLNWENPQVRQAIYAMMRWWLQRGVDGFRMDVINLISKVKGLPDGPVGPTGRGSCFEACANGPRFHEFLAEMHREVFDAYPDRTFLTVGETPGIGLDDALKCSDPARREVDMVFQFEHVGLDNNPGDKFAVERPDMRLADLAGNLAAWQEGMGEVGWNSLYFENHDQPRSVSRWGDEAEEWRAKSAKALAGMLHAHRGTPYVYQGQELGMINVPWTKLSEFRDLEVLNYVAARAAEGRSFAELLPGIARVNRDNARTPMQWSDEPGAGFTTGEPWLALNPAAREINAAAQVGVAGSVFEFYRELIALRRELPVLVAGDFELLSPALIDAERPTVWAVRRTFEGEQLTALANFSREDVDIPEQWWPAGAEVVLTSEDVTAGQLRGWQVVYLRH